MMLKTKDPELFNLEKAEAKRQQETFTLIPSENYAPRAVRESLSSMLCNKYSEGIVSKRYYQGQRYIDKIETLAIERAKKLFKVPFANVQPYSGSPANAAVYCALLEPGDKIMGLSLASGGHLTHGVPKITFSGKFFTSVQYEVGKDGFLHYDAIAKLARHEKPKLIIAGITHYPRALDFKKFAEIADSVGAILMADVSHIVGLIIAGVHQSPVPYCHVITTTTHKTLRGPRGAMILVTDKGLKKDSAMGDKINKGVFPGIQGGPHDNTTAAIATCLKLAGTAEFKRYGKQIVKNAKALSQELIHQGLALMSGGTDNHVMVVDLRKNGILGNTAAEGLEQARIVANRNAVPFDANPPYYPSGIRLGTPAVTTRAMKEPEMKKLAVSIKMVIDNLAASKKTLKITDEQERKKEMREKIINNSKAIPQVAKEVFTLCKKFPIPEEYK